MYLCLHICTILLIGLGDCSFITMCLQILIRVVGEFEVFLFFFLSYFLSASFVAPFAYSEKKIVLLFFMLLVMVGG